MLYSTILSTLPAIKKK